LIKSNLSVFSLVAFVPHIRPIASCKVMEIYS
jgi:hypothetical protein